MAAACRTEGCTVGDTGVCLLGNNPDDCEFRLRGDGDDADESDAGLSPVLDAPEERPTLWGSLPLDIEDVRELMAERRCLLVGVLGAPAAGKTAAMVSMYLRVAHGALEGFQFADSRSLMAFEEISQGARLWGQSPPDEMTARTETSGGRAAGFLHTRLKRLADGRLIDLLVPDLPGEWSDALIDSNRVERFTFLNAADVVWVFVNGSDLRRNDMRMFTLNRTGLLLRRLAAVLGPSPPPVKLVVSHADRGALPDKTVERLRRMCADAGLRGAVVEIASFSEGELAPGSGIADLIACSVPAEAPAGSEWPDVAPLPTGRFMLRYTGVSPA